jgi:hypothetical protein
MSEEFRRLRDAVEELRKKYPDAKILGMDIWDTIEALAYGVEDSAKMCNLEKTMEDAALLGSAIETANLWLGIPRKDISDLLVARSRLLEERVPKILFTNCGCSTKSILEKEREWREERGEISLSPEEARKLILPREVRERLEEEEWEEERRRREERERRRER